MSATPLDILVDELALVAGRVEREAALRLDAALADVRRVDAERELRLQNLERVVADRLGTVRDGVPGRDGADGKSVCADDLRPMIEDAVRLHISRLAPHANGSGAKSVTLDDIRPMLAEMIAALPKPKDGDAGAPGANGKDGKDADPAEIARLLIPEVERAVASLPKAKDGTDGKSVTIDDVAPLISSEIDRAVAALPKPKDGAPGLVGEKGDPGRPGEDGKSVTVAEVLPMLREEVAKQIASLPAPKDGADGKNADMAAVAELVEDRVKVAVSALPIPKDGEQGPPGRDGVSVAPEDVIPLIRAEVERHVATLPVPKDGAPGARGKDGADGTSVSVDDVMPAITAEIERRVAAIPSPKDGKDGADGLPGRDGKDGRLPIVRAWSDRVHYEGEVVALDGATYQAVRDTGRAPPHQDWICLAAAGKAARSPRVRETYDPNAKDYSELDIVALNGAAFIARKDDPGPCPGAGWQMIAMQGKQGKPGERGLPGQPGERGPPGPAIERAEVDAQGLLTMFNTDGSTVECDFYTVLAKVK